MIVALAIILILNGIFNIAVWPTFFRRVARDPRARTAEGKAAPFLVVHAVIVSVALALAVVSIIVGALALGGIW